MNHPTAKQPIPPLIQIKIYKVSTIRFLTNIGINTMFFGTYLALLLKHILLSKSKLKKKFSWLMKMHIYVNFLRQRLIVVQEVAGSSPVFHPFFLQWQFFFKINI